MFSHLKTVVLSLLTVITVASGNMVETDPGVFETTSHILVVLEPGVVVDQPDAASFGVPSLDALAPELGVVLVEAEFPGSGPEFDLDRHYLVWFDPSLASKELVDAAVEAYESDPNVRYAEAVRIHRVDLIPNDPKFGIQWALNPEREFNIRAHRAWDVSQGSVDVVIAVPDTGVAYDHEDLALNVWHNPDEVENGIDDDANGYVDDVIGWDWVDGVWPYEPGEDADDPDNDPMDYMGHGTHISGIASAVTDNGKGVAGTNWITKIMCLRVGWSDWPYGYVMMSFAAQAIYYAADEGADAVNCSWDNSNTGGLGAAVDYAISKGVVFAAAAGNDGNQSHSYLCGRADVLAVASIDQFGKKSDFSNYGTWVDVCAPGTSIYSTMYRGNNDYYYYTSLSGTSMAAPFVSGLAGLVRSVHPGYSEAQVRNAIKDGCWNIDWNNPGYEGLLGEGLINCYNAISDNDDVELLYFEAASTPEGVELSWDAEEHDTVGYNLYRRSPGETHVSPAGEGADSYAKINRVIITGARPYVYLDAGLDPGTYEYLLEEVDGNGVATAYGPVSVEHEPSEPGAYALGAPSPNPVAAGAAAVTVKFSVPATHSGKVAFAVYDLAGRKALGFSRNVDAPGTYEVPVDVGSLAPGLYLFRMTAGGFSATRKVVVVR